MKILQLCPRVPYPPVDGGTIGMYNLSNGLVDKGAEVKVLAFNTKKHFIRDDDIDPSYRKTHKLETVYLDNTINPLKAFFNLFSGESYHIARFKSEAFAAKLRKILQEEMFDIVQIDYLPMALYIDEIREHSSARIVFRAHNVEYRIWQRLSMEEKNPIKSWYLSILAKRLKAFEVEVLSKADALVSLTEEETSIFKEMGYRGPVCIAPTCFNIEPFSESTTENEFTLFHLGAMDWRPNQEGIEWFMKYVWPRIEKELPKIKLYIAGNKMPDRFFNYASDRCIVKGRVEDARKFMSSHSVMIVPVLAGSGIRVKIVEGMALGKAIISTSQGAEGLHYENNKNIMIADTADEMFRAVSLCYANPGVWRQLGINARSLAENYYNMKKVSGDVMDFYSSILTERAYI